MDPNSVLIPVLTDADISTPALNTLVTIYGQPLPFIHSAKELNLFLDIYFKSTNPAATTTIAVVQQWSVDKVNWADGVVPLDWSTTATGMIRATLNNSTVSWGPFVRFNVTITDTAGAAAARLTVVVNVRFQ